MSRIISILLICISGCVSGQIVNGAIKNKENETIIAFASVVWKKKQTGTVSDMRGEFSIPMNLKDTLVFSAIGFKTLSICASDFPEGLKFYLKPESEILEDVQIQINRKKKKRDRKRDIAYHLHKEISRHREQNDLKKRDYYTCNIYNKVEIDLNNIDSNTHDLLLFKPISFVFDKPDTSSLKKSFAPIFLSEGYSTYFFKNAEEKEVIIASKNAGVKIPSIAQYTGNIYTDFNIYSNYIRLLQKQFISPLARASWLSYNYYLTDSVLRNDTIYYRLDFLPRRKQDFAFQGYLIADNKSFGVHEIELRIPKRCNINFIEEFVIKQKYIRRDSVFLLNKEKILIDVNPLGNVYGFYIQKKTQWLNYDLISDMPKRVFLSTQKTIVNDSAYQKGDQLLNEFRPNPLEISDSKIYKTVDSAMNTRYLKTLQNLSIMAYSGYYPFKFWEFGPYQNTFSFNTIEGNRYRFGGQTTQNSLKETRFRGYFAFGDIDRLLKFRWMVTRFFNFKKWRYLEFDYLNDYKQFPNGNADFEEDDLFSALSRRVTPKFTYSKRIRLKWFHEWQNGVNNYIELKSENISPTGDLLFKKENGEVLNQLNFHVLKIGGRVALNERFLTYGFRRLSIGTTKPRFNYDYTYGLKINNSGFEFHKLKLEMSDRYLFGFFGFLDIKLFCSKIWGHVPYPILLNHQGNNSYYLDKEAFNLMNPFEFTSDMQISLLGRYNFNGLLMNRMPFIKKMKLRSFVFANSAIGTLSSNHEQLVQFPEGLSSLNIPYFETGFGIENILHLIRLDFIWRITNLNFPNTTRFCVGFSFEPSF